MGTLRLISIPISGEILDAWFDTPFGSGEDADNVIKVTDIEKAHLWTQLYLAAQDTAKGDKSRDMGIA